MFNKFTFHHNTEQKAFFTSDTHFCHNKDFIYGPRGFSNVNDHDEKIIENWNSVVGPNDNVIHLGDFLVGAGSDSFKRGQEILFRLNGHIHFTWGNHNSYVKEIYKQTIKGIVPNAVDTTEIYPIAYMNKITFYGNNLLAKIKTPERSQFIFCSHFRHRLWIDSHKGEIWHISGHSHGSDPESQPEFKGAKCLDVGVDNFPYLLSFDQLSLIMKTKGITEIDHHNKKTNSSF